MQSPFCHRLTSCVRAGVISVAAMLSVGALLTTAPAARAKSASTYYTPAKVKAMRQNVSKYDWAKKKRDKAVKHADYYLRKFDGLEGLWNLVTAQSVPRADLVNSKKGSPITGKKLFKGRGFHPWKIAPDDPWKIIDPTTDMKFPTNDFAAYYKSGLDEHHVFDADKADKSLLVNKLYPDRGKKWGVDDGNGWTNEKGDRFTFVGYYNQLHNWWHGVYKALPALRDAYLYTGDVKYARAGLVLLDRVADVYPAMDLSQYPWGYAHIYSDGGTHQGKVRGSIFAAKVAPMLCNAYDAFYPAADDAKVVAFLNQKAKKYKLGDKSSARAIRHNIERNLIKQILPAVKKVRISGNFGLDQAALAMSAVVADEPGGYTKKALDFMFQAGGRKKDPWRKTGGNVIPHLVDIIDRNGQNDDVSPGYNMIPLLALDNIAQMLVDYDGYHGFSLNDSVKFKAMHTGRVPLLMIGDYYPHIGDAGATGDPSMPDGTVDSMLYAFRVWGDKPFAVAAYIANGATVEGLHGPITSADPMALPRRIKRIVDERGSVQLPSTSQAGYGLSVLRDGRGAARRAAWVRYGRTEGSHAHHDALNLGYFGFGLDLLPDLGYPTRTGKWPKRHNWTEATISHNTVTVDAEQQHNHISGSPRHFAGGGIVQLTDVATPRVYPQTDLYRRLTAMIRVDDDNSYLVNFFRVRGGDDHVLSFHAAEGEIQTDHLNLKKQAKGTYAGPDVPLPDYGKDTPYNKKGGWPNQGFNYLHDVSRDKQPAQKFAVDWRVRDTWGAVGEKGAMTDVHLRQTMLGKYDEAALALGNPPDKKGNPESLHYLLLRRRGKNLKTIFTSVTEPYRQNRFVKAIEALPVQGPEGAMARAVKVTLQDGRTDYIVSALNRKATCTVKGGVIKLVGEFGFLRLDADGQPSRAYVLDGTRLSYHPKDGPQRKLIDRARGRLTGKVVSFTQGLKMNNHLLVSMGGVAPRELSGRTIYVENDGKRNGAYRIRSAKSAGPDQLMLDLGEITLVRQLKDPKHFKAGFVYNIKPGAPCYIPLDVHWQAGG